jgi:hypothetical protein
MKVTFLGALSSALLVGAGPAVAQTAAAGPAPAASLMPAQPNAPIVVAPGTAPDPNVLRVGTPVMLKMSETITTRGKKLEAGYLAHLEVMDPVLVNGVVVIPVGSPAVAEITDVRNKGMWGKSGHINARMLYVTVGDRRIRLRGVFDDKGVTGTAGVVAAIATVPLVGFFTTGTSATLDMGAGIKGFVDEDVPLKVAAAAPAPLVVASASTPPSVFAPPANAAVAGTAASQPQQTAPAAVASTPAVVTAAATSAQLTVAASTPVLGTDPAASSAATLTLVEAKKAHALYTASGRSGSIYQVNEGPNGTVASVDVIIDDRIVTVPGSTLSAGKKPSQLNTSLTAKEVGKL